ncbi:MAG TPA: alpha/beta hydrolase [Geobacteraceae bacterium]
MTGGAGEGSAPRRTFRLSETVSISYRVHGRGGTPIVFLHGFAASLTTWHDLVPFFAPERYTLYLLDLKGFGRSSKPADGHYRPEDQAAVVTAFLEHEGLSGAILAGHSLGGGIAILAYLHARRSGKEELIGRLVLIDCAARPQRLPPVMRLLRVPGLGWCILNLLPIPFMVRYTLRRLFRNRQAITRERIARYVDSYGGKGTDRVFIGSCRQLVPADYAPLIPLYRTIGVPVLIVWGREDRIILLEQGLRLRDEIPGARLAVIGECGHNPHEERPAETHAAIRDFLEGR